MKGRELNRQLQRIDALLRRVLEASGSNVELSSHWAKYLCVLAAGFLENAIQDVYSRFVRLSASEPVQAYAISRLDEIKNPKTRRFIEVASSFRRSWGEELGQFVAEDGRREAIDSIMQNRHQIAHGGDSGITVARVRDYLDKSVQVVEFIENQCGL